MFGKSRSTISKIGSPSCGHLWLNREVGAMVVFLVSALSIFDSPLELWHIWVQLGDADSMCLCLLKAARWFCECPAVAVEAWALLPLALGERLCWLPSGIYWEPFMSRSYARCYAWIILFILPGSPQGPGLWPPTAEETGYREPK